MAKKVYIIFMICLLNIFLVSCNTAKNNTEKKEIGLDDSSLQEFPQESSESTYSLNLMYSDADLLKYYEHCLTLASNFCFSPDNFCLDMDSPYLKNAEENAWYYSIKKIDFFNEFFNEGENFILETKQDIIAYLCNYFSRDIAENFFEEALQRHYLIEYDGKIWGLFASRSGNAEYNYKNAAYHITREYCEDDYNYQKIILKIDVNIFELGSFLDNNAKLIQEQSFVFNCEHINDRWIFTKFIYIPNAIDDFYKALEK